MHLPQLSVLVLSALSLCADGAPFAPRFGLLQLDRRRAVDYPLQTSKDQPQPIPRRKRVAANYSVVQVDGSEPTTASISTPAALTTIVQTVTAPAPTIPAATQTELPSTTVSETPQIVFVTQSAGNTTPTVVASPTTTSTTSVPTIKVETIIETVAPPAKSTAYYDDGLWHTYYPIRSDNLAARKAAPTAAAAPVVRLKSRALPEHVVIRQYGNTRTELDGMKKFMDDEN